VKRSRFVFSAGIVGIFSLACSGEVGEVGSKNDPMGGSVGSATSGTTGSAVTTTGSTTGSTMGSPTTAGTTTGDGTTVGSTTGAGTGTTSGAGGAGGVMGSGGRADAGMAGASGGRGGTAGAGGSAPRDAGAGGTTVVVEGGAGCGLANVVTQTMFDAIFPLAGRNTVYTYAGFIAAASAFPTFVNTGTVDACRKEAAAFLANVARETGRLRYAEQIAKSQYCSSRNACACDPAGQDQTKWYYGRGALQLSWNYNYCAAGAALGADLLGQPNTVSTDSQMAWKTALWFWMTQEGAGSMTCHAAMTGSGGFGETIRTINGGVECNMGGYGANEGVTQRVDFYIDYAHRLGIANPGTPQDNDC
jgi:predicted chitinase